MIFSDYFICDRRPAIIIYQGILFVLLITLMIQKCSVDLLFICL